MKKFSITLLPLLLTFAVLQAESAPLDEDVSSLLSNYDKETLTEISNELIKMANEEHASLEYELASSHYNRALQIREAIGLSNHKSFASILYLASVTNSKAGNYCMASEQAKRASESFSIHGVTKYVEKASKEHSEYRKACGVLAFK
ncbi:MAG: tetratricopeptide repeat protein [Leptospira sp.]|nr:tetratricopeptide repeat protein [Leptospira sp.]